MLARKPINGAEVEDAALSRRAPWNPFWIFYLLSLFFGFMAAGIVAGINWNRLGKPERTWPTIVISAVAWGSVLYLAMRIEIDDQVRVLAYFLVLVPAFVLSRLQRPYYLQWEESGPATTGAGWGIPLFAGLGSLAVTFALVFLPGGTPADAIDHYEKGVEFFHESRWEEAVAELDEAIRLDPEFIEAYNGRCVTLANIGRVQEALIDCDEAIRLDRQFAVAYFNRAAVYMQLDQHDRALAGYSEYIRLEPQDTEGYVERALTYTLLGRDVEALQDVDRAEELGADATLLKLLIEGVKAQR